MTNRAEKEQPEPFPTLGDVVDRLADLVPNGHLLAATSATDLLVGACDEIDRLRSTIADAYETVGEDWKTCDATLGEAIAAELGEYDEANPEALSATLRENQRLRARVAEMERDLDACRVDLVEAQHAVGEAWFTGGATLAEAIERKCRMLGSEAAKAAAEVERYLRDNEMACENTPWPGCECPGCETARERAVNEIDWKIRER